MELAGCRDSGSKGVVSAYTGPLERMRRCSSKNIVIRLSVTADVQRLGARPEYTVAVKPPRNSGESAAAAHPSKNLTGVIAQGFRRRIIMRIAAILKREGAHWRGPVTFGALQMSAS